MILSQAICACGGAWKSVAEKYPAQTVAADAAFQRGVALKEADSLMKPFASNHLRRRIPIT